MQETKGLGTQLSCSKWPHCTGKDQIERMTLKTTSKQSTRTVRNRSEVHAKAMLDNPDWENRHAQGQSHLVPVVMSFCWCRFLYTCIYWPGASLYCQCRPGAWLYCRGRPGASLTAVFNSGESSNLTTMRPGASSTAVTTRLPVRTNAARSTLTAVTTLDSSKQPCSQEFIRAQLLSQPANSREQPLGQLCCLICGGRSLR